MSTTKKQTTVTTTVNRNKRGNKKRRNAPQPITPRVTSAVHMAPCTRMYTKALVNPFAVQGHPCIPDNIVLPSHKFTTKCRGVFSAGTGGVGWVVVDPFQMAAYGGFFDGGQSSSVLGGAVYYTDSTYTRTDLSISHGVSGAWVLYTGVQVANSNSMFPYNSYLSTNQGHFQFRLVGCGLRVKYIGSNLYNAGRLVIFRNQGNTSIGVNSAYVAADFLQDNYTVMTTVTRSDKYVYYVPDDPTFLAYNAGDNYMPNLLVNNPRHFSMGVYIDGGASAPNNQSWEFEVVAHFEQVGQGLTLTKSEGDPVGHDIVMSSLPNTCPTTSPVAVENSVISQFLKGFNETTREVAYNVGRRALGYATSAAVSYMTPSSKALYLMPS